jgi:hypothetical protein
VSTFKLTALVVGDLLVAIAAPASAVGLNPDSYWPLQIGAALIGVWTFLMVWMIQHGADASERRRTAVRDAIAAAFVTTYLVIVSWSVFSRLATNQDVANLDPLAVTLVSHFTYLTGIVVAAHVGAGALEKFGAQRSGLQPDATGPEAGRVGDTAVDTSNVTADTDTDTDTDT